MMQHRHSFAAQVSNWQSVSCVAHAHAIQSEHLHINVHLLQVKSLRAQAEKLNEMEKMNAIVLEKERSRHVQSFLEQQASHNRIGKPHRSVSDDTDFAI